MNDKKLTFLKGKSNKGLLLVEDLEKFTFQIITNYSLPSPPKDLPLDQIFSDKGFVIKSYRIRALGNKQNMTVRVLNFKNGKSMFLRHNELLDNTFLNSKLPKYVKSVLLKFSTSLIRLEIIEQELPKQKVVMQKIFQAVFCKRDDKPIALHKCILCDYSKLPYERDTKQKMIKSYLKKGTGKTEHYNQISYVKRYGKPICTY